MAKNKLAKMLHTQRVETFHKAMSCFMKLMTVALNDEFGFGKVRLQRLEKRFDEVFEEYGVLVLSDTNYGNAKLKARVEQIMKGGAE